MTGVDADGFGEHAIAAAFAEAAHRRVPLVALHARSSAEYRTATTPATPRLEWERAAEEHHRSVAERLAGWQERHPDVEVRRVVVPDRPAHHLVRWSHRAQLVVVGSRGRSGLPGLLLGSTGRIVTGAAACPVMVVPPGQGPESPC
ncbi:universal stress protein [Amycolatopsis sp. NPDC006131]|uniref:universal stress protein n=1 Tax=Amycolatopsis sp. NPDC006131 TaxID=3156731 RepID=UPI0033BC2A84